jgi:hypothetical protein
MDSSCRLIKRPQKYLRRRVWDAPDGKESGSNGNGVFPVGARRAEIS